MSYLHSVALTERYQELVAALLPASGSTRTWRTSPPGQDGRRADHPYARWIATYADAGFAALGPPGPGHRRPARRRGRPGLWDRMAAAFERGCEYEWLFWDVGLAPGELAHAAVAAPSGCAAR